MRVLEKELAALDQDIDDTVRGSPAWREKEDLLASVPSVGDITARTLIAELPELGTLDRRAHRKPRRRRPFTRQSGRWQRQSLHRRRPAARSAPRSSSPPCRPCVTTPPSATFRQRLLAAGKPKMVVMVACMRKLLTILNAIAARP